MTVTALDNRARLLAGLSEALRERSYAELTVADVVRHARTSKRTFYEEFADKHDCFVALLRLSNEELSSSIAAAVDPAAPWQDQIRQGVGALLGLVQAEPHLFLNWFRAVPAQISPMYVPGVHASSEPQSFTIAVPGGASR